MSMWVHRLTEIDEDERTATCAACGPVTIRVRSRNKNGNVNWRCAAAHGKRNRSNKKPYRVHVGDTCQRCGFICKHPCQMDVHHIDGNHQNNSRGNLETLCACCHRLEHRHD